MRIAIYGQQIDEKNIPYFDRLLEYTIKNSIEVYIEKNFLGILKSFETFKKLNFPIFTDYQNFVNSSFDIMLIFGGDGTILDATYFVRDSKVPIVGINTGNLGFLASFNQKTFLEKIYIKFPALPRSLLTLEISERKNENFALNEIVVLRQKTVSMIIIDTYIGEEFLTSYRADGLIISTPTGSTGYSLSCGGPIMTPYNKNFLLTPIAPHNLFSRPLIISDNELIYLKVHSRSYTYSLSLDTRLNFLSSKLGLFIKKASFYIYLVQEDQAYYKVLRDKLLWGVDPRNKASL
jgi:NAD+ kinase